MKSWTGLSRYASCSTGVRPKAIMAELSLLPCKHQPHFLLEVCHCQ